MGTLIVELHIPQAHSLKEKRSVVKSVIARTREKFNVSVAEVDYHDMWQRAEIAVAVVSGSHTEVDRMLETILIFIQSSFSGDLISVNKEVL
ncbi:MAG: DUF503 domain-containing protein [Peptococcaceae bacterium]|nr:DUF503 domain-containing protein [Peptococcaceae bacterium]